MENTEKQNWKIAELTATTDATGNYLESLGSTVCKPGKCCGLMMNRDYSYQITDCQQYDNPLFGNCKRRHYFKCFLKKSSSLSNGIISTLSYRSVCTAPGIIISSLLLPFNFLTVSSLK